VSRRGDSRIFPKEFRISGGEISSDDLSKILSAMTVQADSVDDGQDVRSQPEEQGRLNDASLSSVCTGLWRARRRMIDPATGGPRDEMRMPFRHLEAAWDALSSAGIEIRDHTDEAIPEHGSLALEVLAYQPTPGLDRERVVDTVRPSVYVNGRVLQMGQVIIGAPEETSGGEEGGTGE